MEIVKLPSLSRQVGGKHYKNQEYELAQFSLDIGLNAMLHSSIKYILRDKDNKAQDLEKAKHCATIYKDWVYIQGKLDPDKLSLLNTNFNFNNIATFISQFEEHERLAMLSILKLQSDIVYKESRVNSSTIKRTIDFDTLLDNYNTVIEHIDRLA